MFDGDFRFGIGMSSYQVEGAAALREPCIWDEYSHTEGKILDKTTGDVATDFYHRYEEDVALAKELGITDFRFSFSWPRLVDKEGNVRDDGLLFYHSLIKCIKDHGMRPVVTIYHWDMPSYLLPRGGWVNRGILKDFARYVEIISEHFSQEVDSWITFNEPQCFLGLGYTGLPHAPSIKCSYHELLEASHHVLLAHSLAYKILKEANPSCEVSFVNTFASPIPVKEDPLLEEKLKEKLFSLPKDESNFYTLSIYTDPLFLGHYPEEIKKKDDCKFILPGDMEKIREARPDYLGLNIYTGAYFRLNEKGEVEEAPSPYSHEEEDGDLPWLKKRPLAFRYGIKYVYERYRLPIMITENGSCQKDVLVNEEVHDEKRSQFILEYLTVLDLLRKEGYPIIGYYYWSLTDNFEWSEGLSKRFGLVFINFDGDLQRFRKDSFYVFQRIIKDSKEGK